MLNSHGLLRASKFVLIRYSFTDYLLVLYRDYRGGLVKYFPLLLIHFSNASSYRNLYPAIDPKNSMLSTAEKVVMITGASRGIDRHWRTCAFAKAGAKAIIITACKFEKLKDTEDIMIKKINTQTKVFPVALEVTNEESVKRAFKTVGGKYESIGKHS
jgi:short chain dehydrogenase